jgi:hypothetical protein
LFLSYDKEFKTNHLARRINFKKTTGAEINSQKEGSKKLMGIRSST